MGERKPDHAARERRRHMPPRAVLVLAGGKTTPGGWGPSVVSVWDQTMGLMEMQLEALVIPARLRMDYFPPPTHPTTLHALALSAAATLRAAATQSELHQAAAIAVALEEVVAVHRVVRGWMAAREGADEDGAVFAGGDESACVGCVTALADVLMLPCQHLVLCSSCCAQMEEVGVQGRRWSFLDERRRGGAREVTCPVCRGVVTEKVTVKRC
ncbi:hypothetical protein DFP73DRAFT_608435 [Morchella snyderi]|nr:hypothetical protein DFP73DRAFT_608435 [Morchella snyderi]